MKILLVEGKRNKVIGHQKRFAPLGLQKIAAHHLRKGDEVEFVTGYERPKMLHPDQIYITTLFTYEYDMALKTILLYKKHFGADKIRVGGIFATLLPELIESQTGIKPHIGLLHEVENEIPNYSLFENRGYRYLTFTSRGCIRKCKFCMVRKHEPEFFDKPNWWLGLPAKAEKIYFGDNNFIAKDKELLIRDAEIIRGLNIPVDFNQALDSRLFSEEVTKILSGIKFEPLRFSYDGEHEKEPIINAISNAKKYNLSKNICVFVLYNFMDTPEEIYDRLEILMELNAAAFPMKFTPIDDVKKNHIGKHWTDKKLKNFMLMLQSLGSGQGVMRIAASTDRFKRHFGENRNEFKNLLLIDNIKEYIESVRN
jgi:hypothetical protein